MSLLQFQKYGNIVQKLHSSIINNSVSHAYIFEGSEDIDKVAFVKAFFKALTCKVDIGDGCDSCLTCRKIDSDNFEDLIIVSPNREKGSSNASIKDKQLEELQGRLLVSPSTYDKYLVVIEDADTATVRAQNRLLKTLEEPRGDVVIVLLTANAENLLPTIRSRCIKYRLTYACGSEKLVNSSLALNTIKMINNKAFFYEIKKSLDGEISNRKEAMLFLEEMESILGNCLRDYNISSSQLNLEKEWIIKGIKYIEEAKNDIIRNVSYKYAIRKLILKLEEE